MFDLYRGVPPLTPVRTPSVKPYEEHFGRSILFRPEELRFKLGDMEPFFCRVSLYDIAADRCVRISEDFVFEINSLASEAMLKGNPGFLNRVEDPVTSARGCIFNVPVASPDVHLVFRFEKILQDNMKVASEAYVKVDSSKNKDMSKFKRAAQVACSSVPFRAPFGYALLALFNDKEDFVGHKTVKLMQVFRQALTSGEVGEESLTKLFSGPSNASTMKKMKNIPATLQCTLEDVTEAFHEIPGRVDPSLMRCVAAPPAASAAAAAGDEGGASAPTLKEGEVLREVQSLPRQSTPVPHLHYVNNFYVRPLSLVFPKGVVNPVAIKVALLEDDRENTSPLVAMYGGFKEPKLVPDLLTPVAYNAGKVGHWYSELKVALPLNMTRKHHLLFTLIEVDLSSGKCASKVIGFAFLPLLQQGAFIGTKHELQLHSTLKTGYLGAVDADLLDGGKAVLAVDTVLVSSVYTQLSQLRQALHIGDPFEAHAEPIKMVQSMSAVMSADPGDTIKFLPLLLTNLFRLICTSGGAQAMLLLTALLTRLLTDLEATGVLMAYAEHTFMTPRFATPQGDRWLHVEIVKHWFELSRVQTGKEASEKFLRSARFLFQIIFKVERKETPIFSFSLTPTPQSMVYQTNSSGGRTTQRSQRFSKTFTRDLEGLLVLCAWQIQQRSSGGPNLLAKSVNRDMALFIRDLFSIMDRGVVFRIIESVLRSMAPPGQDDLALVESKLDFLRVITEYKYWVALNLPLAGEMSSAKGIMQDFLKKHFLASTFLNEVTSYFGHPEQSVRLKTITTLAQLFERHEFDPNYTDQPVAKRRIANIYFPFVLIVSDNIASFKKDMDFGERRLLFSCVLWLLKNCDPDLLRQWWSRETPKRLNAFFDVLAQTLKTFEFRDKEELETSLASSKNVMQADSTKNALESFYSRRGAGERVGAGSAPGGAQGKQRRFATARARRTDSAAGGAGPGGATAADFYEDPLVTVPVYEYDEKMEAHLNTEASLVVLDVVEDFLALFEPAFKQNLAKHVALMEKFLKLLLEFMKRRQSVPFLDAYYGTLRSFVNRFPVFLFQHRSSGNMNPCGPLTLTLVKQLNLPSFVIRSQASASLYLMMKRNFEDRGNFNRMRVETNVALTKLLDTNGIPDDTYYRKGLKAVLDYAQRDFPDAAHSFYADLRELTDRLFRLLEYSVQLMRERGDPEMLADLYHSIARDYKNAPELRVAWLESLSHRHVENECHAEAAQCWVHISALVAQYLAMKHEGEPHSAVLRLGAAALAKVTPNAVEEASFYTRDSANVDNESTYDSGTFSQAILVNILKRAVEYMKKADMFEAATEIYHLLLPIFEEERDYKSLAEAHGDLQGVYQSIIKCNAEESRLFGTYYRVGFFGKEFGHLDGEEFVYREKGLSKLRDISDRLQKIYGPRVGGPDNINIIQQSGDVDPSSLGPGCHIQITRVNPYFEGADDDGRLTYYERNTSVRQFMFEAPFLKDPPKPGKTIADHPKHQWKRKTIITCDVAAPYIRKRLLVAKKHCVEMTPIQVSIAEIEARVLAIRAELSKKPPNSKTLQPMIQGSVKIMVNEGPAKMVEEFLRVNHKDYPAEDVAALAKAFVDFLEASEQAIAVDKDIAPPEMLAFHAELVQGYEETSQQILPFCQPFLVSKNTKKGVVRRRAIPGGPGAVARRRSGSVATVPIGLTPPEPPK